MCIIFLKKQIRKMGKGKKVTKKVVGSANGRAVRGEEANGSTKEFVAAGMGLQELHAAAAEGSGGKSMGPGDVGPPVHSVLDDVVPQPAVVGPSSGGRANGESEPAAVVLTLEQQGATLRVVFKEHARGKKWLAEGDVAQAAATVPRADCERAGRRGQVSVLGLGCSTRCTPSLRTLCRRRGMGKAT